MIFFLIAGSAGRTRGCAEATSRRESSLHPADGFLLCLRERLNSVLLWSKHFSIDPGAEYAHNAMVEIYNSPAYPYLETEIHAPLREIPPGESVSASKTWNLREISSQTWREFGPEGVLAPL